MQSFSYISAHLKRTTKSKSVVAFMILLAGEVLLALTALAAANDFPKRVLIIDSFGRYIAPFNAVSAAFRTTLARELAEPLDIDEAPLDTARFAEPKQEALFVDFLQRRFAGRKLDLVVPINFPAASFAVQHRKRLFPETPMLITSVERRRLQPNFLTRQTAVVPSQVNAPRLIEDILEVLPKTKNIVVIFGASPLEKFWLGEFRRELQKFADRVTFTWFNELSFEEIKKRAAALSPHSVIFYGLLVVDAAGVPYENDGALKSLHAVANAPIFGVYENQLGLGVVGGRLLANQDVGVEAARVALRILRGEVPSRIPTKSIEASAPVYDWRELRRWGISEARLPPGSSVQFRQPTLWEQYRWSIVVALATIAVQAVIIGDLLLQRSRRRRAEAELRESQEFMDLSTSAGELGLWVRDLERGGLWANQRLRTLFGFGQNDVLRFDDVVARIHPDDRSQVVSLVQHAQEDGIPFEADFRVLSNGTERWIAAKGQSVGNAPGGAMRRMGALTDITARKKAELEAQRHRDELAHVSRVSMMGQLASALAHELNQPLGAILRNAEAAELFLQASPPDLHEVRAILADIRKDDRRAGEVIDRMRALLKRRESQWSALDLNSIVEEVAGLLRFDGEARRVKLTLELALSAPPIRGDRVQVQQVLLNLIINAMDAVNGCEAGKRCVAVRVRPRNAEVEVAVSDAGHGIPAENLKRLFEPFFTTKPSGMGLGLAISHTIIQAHGGRLWAENNPDCGATFRFTLPISGEGRMYVTPET
jgi:PAS domain S-box-containing protein